MANRDGGSRGPRGDDARGDDVPTPGDLEEAISRITGVQAARVVVHGGRITEIHVLATQQRGAKQLVRDVQSALLARFGVDIDYRTVSVVQLSEGPDAERQVEPEAPARPAGRPALARIASESDGVTTNVTVDVVAGDATNSGTARGPAASGLRLVAAATLDAVGKVAEQAPIVVEVAEIYTAASYRFAVVILRVAGGRGEQIVSGSALLRNDPGEAAARATLAALNRLLGRT